MITDDVTTEQADLLATLATHRAFLRHTVEGLDDGQANGRTTVSELTLAGILKHVTRGEERWTDFIVRGPDAIGDFSPEAIASHVESFQLLAGETVAGLLARYDEVAHTTEELVRNLPSLDVSHPLPVAPWFEPGVRWSARRVLVHVLAETAQHAGHADIVREALDGQKTMG